MEKEKSQLDVFCKGKKNNLKMMILIHTIIHGASIRSRNVVYIWASDAHMASEACSHVSHIKLCVGTLAKVSLEVRGEGEEGS